MAKQLTINDPTTGVTYTLEYTRKSVEMMEKSGFVAEEVERKPMTMLPALFAGAFLAHHRFVKRDVIDNIYARLTHKDELISALVEMYNEPLLSLLDEPEQQEDNEGNLSIGGELFTKGVKASSDINLKNSIRPIESPLESLEQISGVKFTWNDTSKQDLGVIAQEVQKVYPELVEYTGFLKDSHATVSYNGLVAVLIEAVKELSHRVDNLEKKLENADRNTAER